MNASKLVKGVRETKHLLQLVQEGKMLNPSYRDDPGQILVEVISQDKISEIGCIRPVTLDTRGKWLGCVSSYRNRYIPWNYNTGNTPGRMVVYAPRVFKNKAAAKAWVIKTWNRIYTFEDLAHPNKATIHRIKPWKELKWRT